MIDGYFVHFTEDDPKLEALPKYTVFVLDVSLIPFSFYPYTVERRDVLCRPSFSQKCISLIAVSFANFCQTQVSGSMQGEKIRQLQDAMFTILDDMTEDDYFSILTFNHDVQVGFDFSRYIHSQ